MRRPRSRQHKSQSERLPEEKSEFFQKLLLNPAAIVTTLTAVKDKGSGLNSSQVKMEVNSGNVSEVEI